MIEGHLETLKASLSRAVCIALAAAPMCADVMSDELHVTFQSSFANEDRLNHVISRES